MFDFFLRADETVNAVYQFLYMNGFEQIAKSTEMNTLGLIEECLG